MSFLSCRTLFQLPDLLSIKILKPLIATSIANLLSSKPVLSLSSWFLLLSVTPCILMAFIALLGGEMILIKRGTARQVKMNLLNSLTDITFILYVSFKRGKCLIPENKYNRKAKTNM